MYPAIHMRVGALLLSQRLECALVVRASVDNRVTLPTCSVEKADVDVIAGIVWDFTGLVVRDRIAPDFLEDPAADVRVYVATGVPLTQPLPNLPGLQALWLPLDDFRAPEGVVEDPVLKLAVDNVDAWLNRHEEVRETAASGADVLLASALRFTDMSDWSGPLPSQHLSAHCAAKGYPSPCFVSFRCPVDDISGAGSSGGGSAVCVTCILSHLGVQLTPVYTAGMEPSAVRELAALFALIYMEGAVDSSSPYCHVACVGQRPRITLQPHAPSLLLGRHGYGANGYGRGAGAQEAAEALVDGDLEEMQAMDVEELEAKLAELLAEKQVLIKQQQAVDTSLREVRKLLTQRRGGISAGRVTPMDTGAGLAAAPGAGEGSEQQRTAAAAQGGNGAGAKQGAARPAKRLRMEDNSKNPIQVLKELCDKHKWQQPEYSFEAAGTAGYTCALSLAPAELLAHSPGPYRTMKEAKSAAARVGVQMLCQRGLL